MSMAEDNAADRSGDVWAEAVAEQEHGPAEQSPGEPGPVAGHEEIAETGSGERDGAGAQSWSSSPLTSASPSGRATSPI